MSTHVRSSIYTLSESVETLWDIGHLPEYKLVEAFMYEGERVISELNKNCCYAYLFNPCSQKSVIICQLQPNF